MSRFDETGGTLPTEDQSATLNNGEDAPDIDVVMDYVGKPSVNREAAQGLFALTMGPSQGVSLIHTPYLAPAQDLITRAVVTHCESMQETLDPRGVDAIRSFPGRGQNRRLEERT